MEPVALLISAIDLQPSHSFIFSMIQLFSYFNVFGEVKIFHEHLSPKQSRKDWKCCSSGKESAMQI
jgi:hypothetical protein